MQRFVRCPHCKMPHDAAESVCPTTGLRINHDPSTRSRMTEHPPPERSPEPLAFEAQVPQRRRPPPSEAGPAAGSTRSQRHLIGMTVGERYRIVGILGEGGMGTVYDAEHLGLGRPVAIKVLNPAQAKKRVAVKRFQQEARAAGAIGHPNICEVYDLGQLEDGSPFLVMEKLVGQTLADRINREGGLPFDDVADVMIQVLSGLIAAHDKGIVHRDIKPENIFLARRVGCPPIAKILDFGVSKMMPAYATGEDNLDLTRTGMVMGTPYYMSPEQARGQRDLDGRVDVYACGVMMYEAIAGKRPFLAPNYNALLLAIINTSPRPLTEVRPATPHDLEAVVRRAMARHRDDRYVSAMQMMRDLQALELGRSGGRAGRSDRREGRGPALFATRSGELGRAPEAPPPAAAPLAQPRAAYNNPPETPGAAAAMLARSMSESRIPVAAAAAAEPQTRMDIPARRTGASRIAQSPSDSIDIPIEIAEAEQPVSSGKLGEFDDVPTEVFRPGKHMMPRPAPAAQAPRSPSRPPPAAPMPPSHVPVARPALQQPPAARPPLPDDWEGETVVRRPQDILSPGGAAAVAAAAAASRARHVPTFNPDETIKLDSMEIEVEMGEDPRPPPRRR